MKNENTSTTASSTYHPQFIQRLDEMRRRYDRGGYGDPREVSLAEELYHDLETSRLIVQSVLGSASSADVMAMFVAIQQWNLLDAS